MKDFPLKVMAVLIALLLYAFVNSQSNRSVISLIVPVEVQNAPPQKIIVLPRFKQVQVTLRGPSFLLSDVAAAAPAFRVSLPEQVGTRYPVLLTKDDLVLPAKVDVVNIEPNELELVFDNLVSREVPIEVARLGQLSEDLKLLGVVVEPDVVTIEGPETELNSIERIETLPVDMREIVDSQTIEVRLRPPGTALKLSRNAVNVTVQTVSVMVEQTFVDLPVELRSQQGVDFEIDPSLVTVEITGAKTVVKELNDSLIVPYVKLNTAVTAGTTVPVAVELPERVELINVEPAQVRLRAKSVVATAASKKE